MIKGVHSKVSFTSNYRQNCIEWNHYISKSDIYTADVNAYKTTQIAEVAVKLKQKYLRMYRERLKGCLILGNICCKGLFIL